MLKEHARQLNGDVPNSYEDLISMLSSFAEHHAECIDGIHEYVQWLSQRDIIAPCILFTHRVWGDTRRSDRALEPIASTIEGEDPNVLHALTDIVFGLRQRHWYTLDTAYSEISYEMFDSDPERYSSLSVSETRAAKRASYMAIDEFRTFIEMIRDSLRNILIEIEKYREQQLLMYSESFWTAFITRAIDDVKSEPQHWDFKRTLNMWHVSGRTAPDIKTQSELDFAEGVASFANAGGGVLIIGVTDTPPRRIIGIEGSTTDIERKLKYTMDVLVDHLQYDRNIVVMQQVGVSDSNGQKQTCLIIAVEETESPVSVKDKQGRHSYPVRHGPGLIRVDRDQLFRAKAHKNSDNCDFMRILAQYTYDK
ncbi:MAG: ATP-binding protein [Chloroflexi bacterium]|nr:ATP-binding protein [Chloroflexota bacterium]